MRTDEIENLSWWNLKAYLKTFKTFVPVNPQVYRSVFGHRILIAICLVRSDRGGF